MCVQLPGSFRERVEMPQIPHGSEWVLHNEGYGENFGDSDDEGGGNERHGMLAVVHYKLKVTLDINGFWVSRRKQRLQATGDCNMGTGD